MSKTLLINGQWRAAADDETLPVINPAYGREMGRIAVATATDVNAAVQAAAAAFPRWAATSGPPPAPRIPPASW